MEEMYELLHASLVVKKSNVAALDSPFAAILVLAAVTFAWWEFLAWLTSIGFRDKARPLETKSPTRGEEDPLADAR
jgi:hypothetical protein